jgi:hypothetical protein
MNIDHSLLISIITLGWYVTPFQAKKANEIIVILRTVAH